MSDVALGLCDIERTFVQGGAKLPVLRGASLELAAGEIVALLGPSGSGKSTLLQIAGLLEPADGGEISIVGRPCNTMSESERTLTRRRRLGFVYQHHHLLPEFSAVENVMLPQMVAGHSRRQARERAGGLLTRFGLGDRLSHRPGRLSGGEQQRVAIARAVANEPAVLLADEPTGNLDHGTAGEVFAELMAEVRTRRLAALVATHNTDLAGRMDRVVTLREGLLEGT
jgi:lipoprotein-releasing system ATP-binding protein